MQFGSSAHHRRAHGTWETASRARRSSRRHCGGGWDGWAESYGCPRRRSSQEPIHGSPWPIGLRAPGPEKGSKTSDAALTSRARRLPPRLSAAGAGGLECGGSPRSASLCALVDLSCIPGRHWICLLQIWSRVPGNLKYHPAMEPIAALYGAALAEPLPCLVVPLARVSRHPGPIGRDSRSIWIREPGGISRPFGVASC
jgi:hypothetical protein